MILRSLPSSDDTLYHFATLAEPAYCTVDVLLLLFTGWMHRLTCEGLMNQSRQIQNRCRVDRRRVMVCCNWFCEFCGTQETLEKRMALRPQRAERSLDEVTYVKSETIGPEV